MTRRSGAAKALVEQPGSCPPQVAFAVALVAAAVQDLGRPDELAGPVLPYRLGMPARKRLTPQDAATARRILLNGMARDTGVSGLAGELAPLHPRGNTFPGEVLLQVAADALEWCGASRADPLALEGMPERFLPECAFRGRENKKLQFTVLAGGAAWRGRARPAR